MACLSDARRQHHIIYAAAHDGLLLRFAAPLGVVAVAAVVAAAQLVCINHSPLPLLLETMFGIADHV